MECDVRGDSGRKYVWANANIQDGFITMWAKTTVFRKHWNELWNEIFPYISYTYLLFTLLIPKFQSYKSLRGSNSSSSKSMYIL